VSLSSYFIAPIVAWLNSLKILILQRFEEIKFHTVLWFTLFFAAYFETVNPGFFTFTEKRFGDRGNLNVSPYIGATCRLSVGLSFVDLFVNLRFCLC
jgi:hypothetical protein